MVKKVEKPHNVHHYLIVGRHAPTEKNPNPKIYKIKLPIKDKKSYIFYTNVKIQTIQY